MTDTVSPTYGELKRMLDKLIWAHQQVRRNNPAMTATERVTEVGNLLYETTDYGTLALLLGIAVDRLAEAHDGSLADAPDAG